MVQYIIGDIHWSLFIDSVISLSMGSFLHVVHMRMAPFSTIYLACISLVAHIQYIDIHW